MTPSFVLITCTIIRVANSVDWVPILSDDGSSKGSWDCWSDVTQDSSGGSCIFGRTETSLHQCQDAGGKCHQVRDSSYIERGDSIVAYVGRPLRVSFYIDSSGQSGNTDVCSIWLAYDNDNWDNNAHWDCGPAATVGPSSCEWNNNGGVNGVVTVDIPSSTGSATLWIAMGSDRSNTATCYFDTITLWYMPATNAPTKQPTANPTTNEPTKQPTLNPTPPTVKPTNDPTKQPTFNPTSPPTINPTPSPTMNPLLPNQPTANPVTKQPTPDPTKPVQRTLLPTMNPVFVNQPTANPVATKQRTLFPTMNPVLTNAVTRSIQPSQEQVVIKTSLKDDTKNDKDSSTQGQSEAFDTTRLLIILLVAILVTSCLCCIAVFVVYKLFFKNKKNKYKGAKIGNAGTQGKKGIEMTQIVQADAREEQHAQEVKSWLERIGLERYYPLFMNNGYDSMAIIQTMEDISNVEAIGIKKLGHKNLIWLHIKQLQVTPGQINTDTQHIPGNVDPDDTTPTGEMTYGGEGGAVIGSYTVPGQQKDTNMMFFNPRGYEDMDEDSQDSFDAEKLYDPNMVQKENETAGFVS